MNHALRVDDDLDHVRRRIKQPACLDNLEALVHHGGRIDRNLASHHPVWMGARLIGCHVGQIGQGRIAERATGCSQQNFLDAALIETPRKITGQRLENGIVFAVHRQQRRAMLTHRVHEQLAGHHQHLLVGQHDLFTGARGGERWFQASGADDSRHHSIHFRQRRQFNE